MKGDLIKMNKKIKLLVVIGAFIVTIGFTVFASHQRTFHFSSSYSLFYHHGMMQRKTPLNSTIITDGGHCY